MKKLLVLSLILLGLFAAQGEAQTLCIGPNCPGTGGGGGGTDLTIGVSTITGGTNARVLYDNAGVVGEYPITGTGNVVLSTAPRFGGTVNFGTASTTTGSIAMFKVGSAFGVTIGTTDQTVGNVALTIPDFASVADTFVFTTLAQTLSNKTFVAPALGTPASGVMTNVTGTASGLTAGAATLAISTSALKSATTTVNVDAATAPTTGQVLTATDSTHATWQAAGGGGSPGGSNTQVQFNDSSAFGGDAGLTYNKTTDRLSVLGGFMAPATGGVNCTTPEHSFTGNTGSGISGGTTYQSLGLCTNGTIIAYSYIGEWNQAVNYQPATNGNIRLGSSGSKWGSFYLGGTGLFFDRTITAGGTTGAQTINKLAGTVNFAAAATTLVVTNSLVTTSSIILLTPQTADTTCIAFAAVRAAGSFTITANAACAAETAVGWLVTN